MNPHGYPHHGGQSYRNPLPQSYPYYPHSTYTYPPPTYHYPPPNPYPFLHHYLPPPYPYPFHTHNHHPHPYETPPLPFQENYPSQSPNFQENDSLSSKDISQNIESKRVQMMKKIDPSYTHEPNLFPNYHPNTHYPPPSQIHQKNNTIHFFETLPSFPYFTHTNHCDYIPPAKDEIEILKEKIEAFTRMAKEDTANLKAEIKSKLKTILLPSGRKDFH